MAKEKIKFICQQCGYESPQYLGKCPNCESWNSLVETVVSTNPKSKIQSSKQIQSSKPIKLSEIATKNIERMEIGIDELDQVVGGGLVPGQVVLLAGEPGVGKSTLLLQLADMFSKQALGDENLFAHELLTAHSQILSPARLSGVFYISGEESVEQISIRAKRLGVDNRSNITLFAETNVENIIQQIANSKPALPVGRQQTVNSKKNNSGLPFTIYGLLIIDSIQTMWTEELTGTPGSVGQVRECARKLIAAAKSLQIPLIIVGHVTKEGAIAGPKVLEHLVDTVLYFEGERFEKIRILRVTKNRFGPIDEVGVFKMEEKGFAEVFNPSEMFFEKRDKDLPGSATTVVLEGTRPLLVEIQALVSYSELKSPRRIGNGVSFNRLIMICAIIAKHLRLPLEKFDVYVNVSGGLKIEEPAADLAIAMAVYSSFKNKTLTANSCYLGELSLLGEIRMVSNLQKRVKEAQKLGFSEIYSRDYFGSLHALALDNK